ncbi:MAG: M28 family peptidase, partial [Gemmatimonadota bacterium]
RPSTTPTHRLGSMALLLALTVTAGCAREQDAVGWFGVEEPGGLGDVHSPILDFSSVSAPPAAVPAGEEAYTELEGERIQGYLRTITNFSVEDRAAGNQAWGRVTGREAHARTSEWIAEQFREAGLEDVEVQEYEGSDPLWWPTSWEVRLLADPRYGEASRDVVLESAFPSLGIELPEGGLTAALIDAGSVDDELAPDFDGAGKVAVLRVEPASGVYSVRRPTTDRAQELFDRGAAAVLIAVKQAGNMHVRDFRRCGGPCFALGTADGDFLMSVMDAASAEGLGEDLMVHLDLEAEIDPSPVGHNVLGIAPGDSEENVIVNAHSDGWFDGAGDNGDGTSVLIALARHFAQPEHRDERTLVFVASGGHHTPGANGPGHLVEMNPDLTGRTVAVVNLEHVAQYYVPADTWTPEPTEQPMGFGISNLSPAIVDIAERARERYGFAIREDIGTGIAGDLGGYRPLGVPLMQAIHSGVFYHTSGDVFGTISVPGLERAARFYAYLVGELAATPQADLMRAGN